MPNENKPILLTYKRLIMPVLLAKGKLQEILDIMSGNLKEVSMQGLFVLGVSSFEIMLSDVLIYFLKNIPEKLDIKEARFSKYELLYEGELTGLKIERWVNDLSYKNVTDLLERFYRILSIDSDYSNISIDNLIEIKETRNLLLHNNLVVNNLYLQKAGKNKRADRQEVKLKVDQEYIIQSVSTLYQLVIEIEDNLKSKYCKYTKIAALQRLWNYLFHSPVLRFEDYWIVDESKDEIPGLKRSKHETGISNSERMFLGMWRAHFNGDSEYLKNFNMKSLDSERQNKMLYFLSIADETSFY